jgi:hypothetical protein
MLYEVSTNDEVVMIRDEDAQFNLMIRQVGVPFLKHLEQMLPFCSERVSLREPHKGRKNRLAFRNC